jgi:hypothetical protein
MVNGENGNPRKREETARRIIAAVKETHGMLAAAAERSGIGYRTVCRYAAESPAVKEAVHVAKETMLDFAESKLFQAINKGQAWAIAFYLKTQGKQRGYIERQEFTGEGGQPIKVELDYREKLISAISRNAPDSG